MILRNAGQTTLLAMGNNCSGAAFFVTEGRWPQDVPISHFHAREHIPSHRALQMYWTIFNYE